MSDWVEPVSSSALDDLKYFGGAGVSPCSLTSMDSPHLYDNVDYKRGNSNRLKANGLFAEEFGDMGELANPELSLDINPLLEEHQLTEGLLHNFRGLSVERASSAIAAVATTGPQGVGASPISAHNNMYNEPLTYVPNAVHGGSQYERHYLDRHVKDEPTEDSNEYSSCARNGSSVYNNNYVGGIGLSGYTQMTPTTIPGVEPGLKSPMRPSNDLLKNSGKKMLNKDTEEYRRRRERNNIAVRKSREKAKLKSKETEHRVKLLCQENEKLQKKCELLSEEVKVFRSVFASLNVHCLPEHIKRELRQQMEQFQQQHQLLSM